MGSAKETAAGYWAGARSSALLATALALLASWLQGCISHDANSLATGGMDGSAAEVVGDLCRVTHTHNSVSFVAEFHCSGPGVEVQGSKVPSECALDPSSVVCPEGLKVVPDTSGWSFGPPPHACDSAHSQDLMSLCVVDKGHKWALLAQGRLRPSSASRHSGAGLLSVGSSGTKCGQLTCPGGFVVQSFVGHACPYCMPNAEMQAYGKSTLQHVEETKGKPRWTPEEAAAKYQEAVAWQSNGAPGSR